MSKLLTSVKLGGLELANRVVMAPMTRGRATSLFDKIPSNPQAIMAQYYAQRAAKGGAGLIITEATAISVEGSGWVNAPGIWTEDQVNSWKAITEVVHLVNPDAKIVLQLWHMGRVSHSSFLGGEAPLGPSAIAAEGESHTYDGKKPYETPREMTEEQIKATIADYKKAGENAKAAGFDGVEIHGANGYLIDQFTRTKSNQRTDQWGGSAENRSRFAIEATKAVIEGFGDASLVGYRASPTNAYNDMRDEDPIETYTYLTKELVKLGIGFLHVIEGQPGSMMPPQPDGPQEVAKFLKEVTPSTTGFIINGGYTKELGEEAISSGLTDAVAYGVPFLANANVAEKFEKGEELAQPDFSKMFFGGVHGYVKHG